MSEKRIVGSIKKVSVDGIEYDVAADADVERQPSRFLNELIQTSGKPMIKQTLQEQSFKGVPIIGTASQEESLRFSQEKGTPFPMAIQYASGVIFQIVGIINITGSSSGTGKITVDILPTENIALQK